MTRVDDLASLTAASLTAAGFRSAGRIPQTRTGAGW